MVVDVTPLQDRFPFAQLLAPSGRGDIQVPGKVQVHQQQTRQVPEPGSCAMPGSAVVVAQTG